MDTNTTHDQIKQENMEHTGDSALAQVTVPPTAPDPVTEVFEINELVSMVLSHLPIKDLTRALSVSKRWQQVILGTVELRQTLFLAPKHTVKKEYLELISTDQEYDKLKKAPPSAFLTQPPIAHFVICHRKMRYDVQRESGVTFGDVVQEFERLHAIHDRRTFDRGTGKPFPQRLKPYPEDWDDKAVELVSILPPMGDGDGEAEFAKYRLFTSQKYDALACGIEKWEGRMVANSLDRVQAARKAMAYA